MEHLHTHRRLYLGLYSAHRSDGAGGTVAAAGFPGAGSDQAALRPAALGSEAPACGGQPVDPLLHPLSGGHCQGNPGDLVRRFEPGPHGAGVGRAVSSERNQPEKLLPGACSGKISPHSCGRHGCAGRQSCCGTPNCGWPRSRHRWVTKIRVNSRRFLPGSSAARRWNIAEGHGSIEPCPSLSGCKKRYASPPFSRHWALSLWSSTMRRYGKAPHPKVCGTGKGNLPRCAGTGSSSSVEAHQGPCTYTSMEWI